MKNIHSGIYILLFLLSNSSIIDEATSLSLVHHPLRYLGYGKRCQEISSPPPRSSQLHFSRGTTESLSAAAAVLCPALIGMKADRSLRSGVGPLVTIIVASHFSSLGISRTQHNIYEIVWTRILPASLSLLLITPSSANNGEEATRGSSYNNMNRKRKRTRDIAKNEILQMTIPFLLGCIGSILGCLSSYLYCWLGKDNIHRFHKHILPGRKHYFFTPGHLLFEPTEAAVAAGCLLSSYIGGSTNYFATAWAIANDQSLHPDAHSSAEEVLQ